MTAAWVGFWVVLAFLVGREVRRLRDLGSVATTLFARLELDRLGIRVGSA